MEEIILSKMEIPRPSIVFTDKDGNEVFSIYEDGMYYKGKLVEIDKDIENAFREFLHSHGINR